MFWCAVPAVALSPSEDPLRIGFVIYLYLGLGDRVLVSGWMTCSGVFWTLCAALAPKMSLAGVSPMSDNTKKTQPNSHSPIVLSQRSFATASFLVDFPSMLALDEYRRSKQILTAALLPERRSLLPRARLHDITAIPVHSVPGVQHRCYDTSTAQQTLRYRAAGLCRAGTRSTVP